MKYLSKEEQDLIQIFTMVAMKLTSQIVDFTYQDMKIGRLIFLVNYIGFRKQCTMKDVIEYMNIKPSTATRQLDKLVNNLNLVSREYSTDDRRLVTLQLTQLGIEVYNHHKKLSDIPAKILVKKFSKNELDIMRKGLVTLLDIFSYSQD